MGSVVLARVGDEVVTADDLGILPPNGDAKARLEVLVRRKLAIAGGAPPRARERSEGPRAKSRRSAAIPRGMEEGLLRNALFNSIRLGLVVSEEDLRAHYEKTKERYTERQWALRIAELRERRRGSGGGRRARRDRPPRSGAERGAGPAAGRDSFRARSCPSCTSSRSRAIARWCRSTAGRWSSSTSTSRRPSSRSRRCATRWI